MIEYTFKCGGLYFKCHAENDKEAVKVARRIVNETSPAANDSYIEVDLDGGGFNGRIYVEPGEIALSNICKREALPELSTEVPF